MIRNALTGEPKPPPKTDFTSEGAPPPESISGTDVPATDDPAPAKPSPPPVPEQHPIG